MKKILIVSGTVATASEKLTKAGKKYYVYQVESMTKDGMKVIDKVNDWENRGLKVGEKVLACAFEQVQIWKEKIIKSFTLTSPEIEKEIFAFLGIVPKQEKIKI
jgi:hypothetical protein